MVRGGLEVRFQKVPKGSTRVPPGSTGFHEVLRDRVLLGISPELIFPVELPVRFRLDLFSWLSGGVSIDPLKVKLSAGDATAQCKPHGRAVPRCRCRNGSARRSFRACHLSWLGEPIRVIGGKGIVPLP